MSQPSVHQSSHTNLQSKTPANYHTRTNKKLNTQKPRTVGPKPKHFEIYIDPHATNPEADSASTRLFKPIATPANPNKTTGKNLGLTSTRKKLGNKPLEDKTNTVRKPKTHQDRGLTGDGFLKESASDEHSSPSLKNKNKPVGQTTTADSVKAPEVVSPSNARLRLLYYRTPTTAKRAPRPPQPLFGSDQDDNDDFDTDNLPPSPLKSASAADTFTHNLIQNLVPDVEYGPPSAIIESVEFPSETDAVDFSGFMETLQDPKHHLISSSASSSSSKTTMTETGDEVEEQIRRVVEEDGHKGHWQREPVSEMTSYEGVRILDDLHLPAPASRSVRPTTRQTRPPSSTRPTLAPASRSTEPASRQTVSANPALRTRSKLAQNPAANPASLAPSSQKKSATNQPPMVARFHTLVDTLVSQEQDRILLDLLSLDEHLLDWEHGLDSFLLDV
ncbi:hypothetical protein PGTUg99_021525 [Puccinia graminis f. sp. tritici]|uniref:Uncharacterized protein n=1 Tax=Puccinia graminis f. sp. tritici TaxID=56615 RepID=A0A5B0SJW6_PUCGR|nr:hypothetical protein PGTUg99_021525 [Puccinia graminis f. sp. tritici]